MKTGNIEFHDDFAILTILTDDLTEALESRLVADGWSKASNGYKENEEWYTLYTKLF